MRLSYRLLSGAAVGASAYFLWTLDALAGFCPNLVNCAGGNIPTTQDCFTGAVTAVALCMPHNNGGEWKDYSDDFGDTDDNADDNDDGPAGGDDMEDEGL